jgi:hypothetical protein
VLAARAHQTHIMLAAVVVEQALRAAMQMAVLPA